MGCCSRLWCSYCLTNNRLCYNFRGNYSWLWLISTWRTWFWNNTLFLRQPENNPHLIIPVLTVVYWRTDGCCGCFCIVNWGCEDCDRLFVHTVCVVNWPCCCWVCIGCDWLTRTKLVGAVIIPLVIGCERMVPFCEGVGRRFCVMLPILLIATLLLIGWVSNTVAFEKKVHFLSTHWIYLQELVKLEICLYWQTAMEKMSL